MTVSITRRFLTSHFLEANPGGKRVLFKCGYPGHQQELQVIQDGNRYYEVLNSSAVRLNRRQFDYLWQHCKSRCVIAHRYVSRLQGNRMVYDEFQGTLVGLSIITVEFKSLSEAYTCEIPEWFGPEITYDGRFQLKALIDQPIDPNILAAPPGSSESSCLIGAIPYIQDGENIKFITINTRKRSRMIFPKGQPEPDYHTSQVAQMEAMEEAGVEGEITGHPILLPYKPELNQDWLLYPLKVTRAKRIWKEQRERTRKYLTTETLIADPRYAALKPAALYVSRLVRSKLDPLVASSNLF
jgi:adenylate cyclase